MFFSINVTIRLIIRVRNPDHQSAIDKMRFPDRLLAGRFHFDGKQLRSIPKPPSSRRRF